MEEGGGRGYRTGSKLVLQVTFCYAETVQGHIRFVFSIDLARIRSNADRATSLVLNTRTRTGSKLMLQVTPLQAPCYNVFQHSAVILSTYVRVIGVRLE